MGPRSLKTLHQLLSILRALHWAHWTFHWKMKGDTAYADHLLFQRLYEATEEEVDGLAEKLISYGGDETTSPVNLMEASLRFLNLHPSPADGPVEETYRAALDMEKHLQRALSRTQEILDEEGELTLGLDDFLAATASAHETALYLLGQKLAPASG